MTLLLVAVGGATGATLRFLVDTWVRSRWGSTFPWGTLAVNAAGSLVLGVVTGAAFLGAPALLGTGLCGALTTFSTFGADTVRLATEGAGRRAVANVLATVCVGLTCGAVGLALGSA